MASAAPHFSAKTQSEEPRPIQLPSATKRAHSAPALRDHARANSSAPSSQATSPRKVGAARSAPAIAYPADNILVPPNLGEFDVHYGAIGCGVAEGTLVKVIGTSTCDCGVVSAAKNVPDIPGICGIVKGAILPGFYGIEAGQSAVGDIFKWWVEVACEGDAGKHARTTEGIISAPFGVTIEVETIIEVNN